MVKCFQNTKMRQTHHMEKISEKCKGYHLAAGKIQTPEKKKDLALSASPPPPEKWLNWLYGKPSTFVCPEHRDRHICISFTEMPDET
jgi:hypothetical protein